MENFAVACNKCNVRKSAAEISNYLADHPPRAVKGKYGEPTHWDGLASLFIVLARQAPATLTSNERLWLSALEAYIRRAKQPR